MDKFIGVKLIEAKPMNRGDYNDHRGWKAPVDEDPTDDGYLVVYPDGYQSWSPTDQFQRAYFPLAGDPSKAGPTITNDDVERFMLGSEAVRVSEKAATIKTSTPTGFDMYETSACVDPKNYDEDIALKIGAERNKNKLWGHLGFVLQWAVNGFARIDD